MTCTRWLSSLRTSCRSRKACEEDGLRNKRSVNEEYLEAFRTKSFIEICNKAQGGFGKTSTKTLSSSSSSSSPSSIPLCRQLTEYLLEPRQETITNITQSLKPHHLLVEYFEASLESCRCCDTILEAIHSMRFAYRRISRVVKLSKRVMDDENNQTNNKDTIFRELASFALQNNPLSIVSTEQFRDIHDKYVELLHSLRSTRRKIRRRLTLKRVCKNIAGVALVTSHSVILVALLVFAFHSMVGLVAAPSILCGLIGLFVKKDRERVGLRACERLCEQLDVAAKGVYILINDLDTMSRMVKRLHDEVEHRRVVAQVCVRNAKCEILNQVMREFCDQESSFLELLDELEGHVYLCFLTTNRSRRLVVQEITEK
ncbi:hypothetical protein Fmac_032935 [Flemingia macrophylla]|uniref:Uncharacterized protein n=1 Tax=Flemingia macrophylla TaxID=520843 RepID=A0ABD1L6C1_9FABA